MNSVSGVVVTHRIAVAIPFLALTGSSPACSEPCAGEAVLQAESEHFVYEYCASDVDLDVEQRLGALERHLEVVTPLLGVDSTEMELPIHYQKFAPASLEPWHAPAYFFGDDNVISASRWPFEGHELIHAYTMPQWGNAVTVLQEGIAVALSCTTDIDPESPPWRRVLAFDIFDDEDYDELRGNHAASGAFVAELLERDSMSVLEDLYRASPPDTTPEEFADTVRSLYKESMDDIWAAAMARATNCVPYWACASPHVTADEFNVGPGELGDEGRVLVVTGEHGIHARISGSALRVLRCDSPHALGTRLGQPWLGDLAVAVPPPMDLPPREVWSELPKGKHVLTLYGVGHYLVDRRSSSTATFHQPAHPWAKLSCESGPPQLLSDEHTTYIVLERILGKKYLNVESVAPDTEFEIDWWPAWGESIRLCSSCNPDECRSVQSRTTVKFQPGSILSVDWGDPVPGYVQIELTPRRVGP